MTTPTKKTEAIDQKLVRAFVHPLRVQILEALQGRKASTSGLAAELAAPLGNVAYHLRVLKGCGCVEKVGTVRVRGATETFYTATPRSFIGHQDWRRVPLSVRAGVTNEAVRTFVGKVDDAIKADMIQPDDGLDRFVAEVGAAIDADTIDRREDTTLNWMPITVDEQGWRDTAGVLSRALSDLTAVAAASRERLGDADGIPVVTGLAAFEAPPGGG
jgi:DNA-binding transcriptional ArsR family regulator